MLSRARYIDALNHPNFFVRSGVLQRLSSNLDPGVDATAAALRAIEEHGAWDAYESPREITHLALDDAAQDWVFRNLESLPPKIAGAFLEWVGTKAPADRLREALPRMKAFAADCSEKTRTLHEARRRLDLLELPSGQALDRLSQIPQLCLKSRKFPTHLLSDAEILCQRLAGEPEAHDHLQNLAREWLSLDLTGTEREKKQWKEAWACGLGIQLAGYLKLEAHVPVLLGLFTMDLDWWNDYILYALNRMRSQTVLETCALHYPALQWHARLFLTSVFEAPDFPELESVLLGLLDGELDDDLRVDLAYALALLGTPEGRLKAREVQEEDPHDPERFAIAEIFYYQYILEGVEDPALTLWRAKMEDIYERVSAGRKTGVTPSEPDTIFGSEPEPALGVRSAFESTHKIGRNDPCPCGSNVKFKSCCWLKKN